MGIPLHFWTVENMKNIGGRLGHVDTIELTEVQMLIDIDSKRPLKFKRKVESSEGDEVTIEIKYDMLFKHCTLCGLMSHEKCYCPTAEPIMQTQQERARVFDRVQIPYRTQDQLDRQNLLRDHHDYGNRHSEGAGCKPIRQSSRYDSQEVNKLSLARSQDYQRTGGYILRLTDREETNLKNAAYRCPRHADRIIRNCDNKLRGGRYGGSHHDSGPYDRKGNLLGERRLSRS